MRRAAQHLLGTTGKRQITNVENESFEWWKFSKASFRWNLLLSWWLRWLLRIPDSARTKALVSSHAFHRWKFSNVIAYGKDPRTLTLEIFSQSASTDSFLMRVRPAITFRSKSRNDSRYIECQNEFAYVVLYAMSYWNSDLLNPQTLSHFSLQASSR